MSTDTIILTAIVAAFGIFAATLLLTDVYVQRGKKG